MRVELREVSKRFGRLAALDRLGLTLEAGSKVALIGPNGSGKSTLTRVIMGLLSYEGSVRLDGREVRAGGVERAQRMGYVPQIAPQLGASVGEILRAICAVRRMPTGPVEEIGRRLGLEMEEIARKPFRALSGGMKQKLLIALALAPPASLLILDEPTASLDAKARQVFFELIAERAEGATLLLCSHRLEEVRHLVGHVIGLESGRVSYEGPVGDYLRSRAYCVVEVYLAGGTGDVWLREHGFRSGGSGGWARTATHEEKISLIRAISTQFNGRLENLVVRDLDLLEDPAMSPAAGSDPAASPAVATAEEE